MTAYALCLLLFMLGVYCVAIKRDLLKIIIGIIIMEYSVIVLFLILGYGKGSPSNSSQPLIVALSATFLATTVIMIAIAARLYNRFGTLDTKEMRDLKG